MTEHNLFVLTLRGIHERAASTGEGGGVVIRQARNPRFGGHELGCSRHNTRWEGIDFWRIST